MSKPNKWCIPLPLFMGHSTTTWTKFWPMLTTYPPWVDNCGHLFIIHMFMWPSIDFLMTTYPPLVVHVVIKWPLIRVWFLVFKTIDWSYITDRHWSNIKETFSSLVSYCSYLLINCFCFYMLTYFNTRGLFRQIQIQAKRGSGSI